MRFIETPLPGAYLVALEPRRDERGFFARSWCEAEFAAHGLVERFSQANVSYNRTRGTLRGLHYQLPPHAEAKLVRCTRGAIFDVAVDLRPESPTYLKWFGARLTARNRRALYLPERFAHGFITLQDRTEVTYQVSAPYAPEAERGIRHDDPTLRIRWPLEATVISDKDRDWPDLVPDEAGHEGGTAPRATANLRHAPGY